MPPTITEAYPPLPLEEVVDLVERYKSMSAADKKRTIERLVQVHPTMNVDWSGDWRYRRARQLDPGQKPETVDELIWRKGAPAALGRANPEGFQVLYLADRQDTGLREVRVEDSFAVVAVFRIQEGRSVRIAPIGELTYVHRTGRGPFAGDHSHRLTGMLNACPAEQARSMLITDAFLLDCLVGHDDYEISSHVVLSIFQKMPTLTAVAYPSVRQFGGINFAVRTKRFWEDWALWSVRYGRARHLAQGFYQFSDTEAVDGIYDSGRLRWIPMPNPEAALQFTEPYTPFSP